MWVKIFSAKALLFSLLLQISGVLKQLTDWVSTYMFKDFDFLQFLLVAVFIDFLAGFTKVLRTEGLKGITSWGLRQTIVKLVQYFSFLIIVFIIVNYRIDGRVVNSSLSFLPNLAYAYLITIEFKSVYENIVKINPRMDFIDSVINSLSNKIKEKFYDPKK